jgi:IclR family transcriptional regulator, acetate operon repressor
MNNGLSRGVAAIEKSLELFLSVVDDAGRTPLSVLATRLGLPISTAQRIVAAFVRSGLLNRVERGRYAAGLRLAGVAGVAEVRQVLIAASRPLLRRLAREIGATVHLGVLEGDMVTYLVKEHGGGAPVLTREMIQLEAYCSGIGKVLLAHLDDAAREAYLAAGPFVALTGKTMTDPDTLRTVLRRIRAQGYAVDDAELEDDLYCLAVPVRGPGGEVLAALSASSRSTTPIDLTLLDRLRACSTGVERRLGRPSDDARA